MKKLSLISFLFIGTLGFSQNAPIDFEPDGIGADFTWATFEAPEGEENPTFSVEPNPSVGGLNESATVAKMDISYATDAPWGSAGCESMHGSDLGAFSFTEATSTVRIMFYQVGFAAPVALKFATPEGAAYFEVVVPNTVADEWVEISFNMSEWIGDALGQPDQIIVFPSYGPRETGHVVYFDNVTFGAGDPPAGDPMVSAPDPTIDEANVLSIYGETYVNNTVSNFNLNAFQGGGTISEVDLESDGNLTLKIDGLTFYGAEWTAVDVNEYTHVHLNYWSSSSTAFNFYLVDATAGIPGGNPSEPRFSFGPAGSDETLVQGEWKSVFIPLQHFLDFPSTGFDYDLDDIFQWKFDGNGLLWVDNVFFTTEAPMSVYDLEAEGFSAYPNPSKDFWTISSENSPISTLVLFNSLGQQVFASNPNRGLVQIEAGDLTPGIYLAQIKTEKGFRTLKLIKE